MKLSKINWSDMEDSKLNHDDMYRTKGGANLGKTTIYTGCNQTGGDGRWDCSDMASDEENE